MKYCTKCGNELVDEAVICVKCGCQTGDAVTANENQSTGALKTAAKIFMIVATVLSGFAIIPLAWCIPMTVVYCDNIKNGKPVSVGFKVCCLLFVSMIGGILMLCDNN